MKKQNDFEFIQQQINASLSAPEQVNEDFVLQQLEGAEETAPSNILPLKKKSPAKKTLPTIAAAVAVVLIAAIGIGVIPNLPKTRLLGTQTDSTTQALTAYTSYTEIKKDLKQLRKNENGISYFVDGGFIAKKSDAMASESVGDVTSNTVGTYGATFTQVDGVDEDDMIKTDGKYIFYAGYSYYDGGIPKYTINSKVRYYNDYYSCACVCIYRADGKNSKLVNKVEFNETEDELEMEISGIYLSDNTLVVMGNKRQSTCVRLYDISDINHIRQTAEFSQSGWFSASRLIGRKLFIVSCQIDLDEIPYVLCGDEKQTIPAESIYKTANPNSAQFLVVSQVPLDGGEKIEQAKAVLGGSGNVYCNEEHMYVLADITRYYGRKASEYHEQSQLFKIDISDGIRFTDSVTINGSAKNQYALDEYNGVFRVAVTDTNGKMENVNRLYTFDQNLKQLGKVEDFARGEHIEAVKFFGDYAYVITYETTDPLFVMDLTDAANPHLLGEVKIDGFSTTLIPVGKDKILGIGTDAEAHETGMDCLKLVLFDISQRDNPKVLDELVCKNIYSDAMWQTKQILKNSERGSFTVYATFYEDIVKKYEPEYDDYYYDYDEAYGALTFSVQGEKIVIEQDYHSAQLSSADGRCTFIGDTVYMVDSEQHIDCTAY